MTTIYKTLYRKLKIEKHVAHLKLGCTRVLREVEHEHHLIWKSMLFHPTTISLLYLRSNGRLASVAFLCLEITKIICQDLKKGDQVHPIISDLKSEWWWSSGLDFILFVKCPFTNDLQTRTHVTCTLTLSDKCYRVFINVLLFFCELRFHQQR